MTNQRDYQADFYSSFAPIRQRDKRINRAQKIRQALIKHVPQNLAQTVCLDIGCSAGVITAELAPLFANTVGIDYDRMGLAAIHPQDKIRANFARADALSLPIKSESVDLVICAQIYEHVPDSTLMMAEIYRVLRPNGYCFFSGPNWLFPIEPHYFLPFLHWLSQAWADRYLRLTRLGRHYYEQSQTIWGLGRLLHRFEIKDITTDILIHFYLAEWKKTARLLKLIPPFVWKLLIPLLPNFNWILRKPK